jgi:nitrogenase iron protein NifH
MALYAANNIAKSIQRLGNERKNVRVGGLIHNQRDVIGGIELVEEFAQHLGIPVIAHIPRSDDVHRSEVQGKTVIEAFPQSEQAQVYRNLAQTILANQSRIIPTPFDTIGELQLLQLTAQKAPWL